MQTGSHGGSLRVLHPTLETNASRSNEGSGFIDLGRGLCRVIVGDARFAVPAHCELSGFRCCVPCTTTSLAPTCGQMTPGCSGLECLKICKADSSCTGVQVPTDLATNGCYTYAYAVRLVPGLGSQRCVLMELVWQLSQHIHTRLSGRDSEIRRQHRRSRYSLPPNSREAEHTALYRRAVPTPRYRGVPLCNGVSQTRRVGRVPSSPSALPRSLPHVACCPRAPQPREVAPSPVGSRARLFVRMAVGPRRAAAIGKPRPPSPESSLTVCSRRCRGQQLGAALLAERVGTLKPEPEGAPRPSRLGFAPIRRYPISPLRLRPAATAGSAPLGWAGWALGFGLWGAGAVQLPQGAVSYGWLVRCAALWTKPLGDNQIRVLFLNIREDAEAGCRVLTEPVLLVRVQTVSAADPAELLRGAASSGYRRSVGYHAVAGYAEGRLRGAAILLLPPPCAS